MIRGKVEYQQIAVLPSERMQWIYIAAQASALVGLLLVRWPMKWFLLALSCWTAQSLNVALAMNVPGWPKLQWAYPEVAVLLVTAAATIEVIRRTSTFLPSFRAFQLRFAALALPASAVGIGMILVAPPIGDALAVFRVVRAWSWAAMAMSLLIVGLLLALERIAIPAAVRLHMWLLIAVLAAHACVAWYVGADDATRVLTRNVYRGVVTAACGGWITLTFLRKSSRSLRASRVLKVQGQLSS